MQGHPKYGKCDAASGGAQLIVVWASNFLTQSSQCGNSFSRGQTRVTHGFSKNGLNTIDQRLIHTLQVSENNLAQHIGSVSPLSAIGRRKSFRRKALASSVFLSPPGVCLWSPHQITRHLRGARAIAEASSRFPYCCPSSLRATSVSSIHDATGLYGCWHSTSATKLVVSSPK